MAATYEQVEAALLAPFVPIADGGLGEWSATTYVAYENVDLDTEAFKGSGSNQVPWVLIEVNGGQRNTVDMSQTRIGSATVIVSAHVPQGWGKASARAIIDAAIAIYSGRLFTAGTSTIKEYSISRPVQLPSDGWYKLAVQISFNVF